MRIKLSPAGGGFGVAALVVVVAVAVPLPVTTDIGSGELPTEVVLHGVRCVQNSGRDAAQKLLDS